MMLRLLILGSLALSVAGQASTDKEIKDSQKAFKRLLMEHALIVKRVEFKGCLASVKFSVFGETNFGSGGSSYSPGGGFPTSDHVGSVGPDTGPVSGVEPLWARYHFDLAKVDVSKIEIRNALRGKNVRINLVEPALVTSQGNWTAPDFGVAVSPKKAPMIVRAFERVVSACTK